MERSGEEWRGVHDDGCWLERSENWRGGRGACVAVEEAEGEGLLNSAEVGVRVVLLKF